MCKAVRTGFAHKVPFAHKVGGLHIKSAGIYARKRVFNLRGKSSTLAAWLTTYPANQQIGWPLRKAISSGAEV